MDVNYSLICAVREGRLEEARDLINSYGLSYSQAWSGGYVLLRDAVKNNHAAVAKLLLTSGCRVNRKTKTNKPSNTPLHFAVRNGDIEIVEMILDKGADIDAENENGRTPLHVAAAIGCLQTVEHLLKYGASVNCVSTSIWQKGYTPLHIAVENRSKEVITLLLSRGANVDVKAEDSITPLHIAAKKGYIHIVEDLLNHGACTHSFTLKEGFTPLHFASELGNEEAVKLFLNKGADINASTNGNSTPLHIATKAGRKSVVKLLLQHGAKVDNRDKDGKTTLHLAVEKGNLTVVENVLKYCPDINLQSNRSSLKIAVHGYGGEYKKIVKALLEYGLLVNPEDANNLELFHAAVEKGYLKIIEDLLKYGADVNTLYNSKFEKRFTPLHRAAKTQREKVAKLLICYGADVNARDETGRTPIFYAVENADLKITKLLLTNRANIKDSPDLLNIAVKKKCIEIVEALLQHDADINAPDKIGKTPIFYAIENADLKITKLFLTNRASIKDSPDLLNIAVKKECIEIVEALLQHDADVNASDKYGRTALHFTTLSESDRCFGFLTNEDPDIVFGFRDFEDPDVDIKGQIAELLLSKGANVDAQTKNGVTTLHAAVEKEYAKVVEVLLKYNANVNSAVESDITLLHLAAQKGNKEIITMLLNKGANVNAKQNNGFTALHIATQEGHKEVVKVLLECGAKVDSKIKSDITLLHFAAQIGNIRRTPDRPLSARAVIASLNGFIAHRGKPATIISDNSTNFVGACNELAKLKNNSNNIKSCAAEKEIESNSV